jgi:hypothetical protein
MLHKHVILVKNVAHAYEVYTVQTHFHVLSMRAIDFSHKVTLEWSFPKNKS